MEKETFLACLSKASERFAKHAADTAPVTEEEEAKLEADMEQDGELATLVARQMGLL